MTVTPDAVEAAARAMQERDPYAYHAGSAGSWEDLNTLAKACYMDLATTAVAAAAPLIAQQAYLDAVQIVESCNDSTDEMREVIHEASDTLTARAATLTPKEN